MTLICVCTCKYMHTDVLHVYSLFTVIFKCSCVLIKIVKMIKDIQGDTKLLKKMYKEVGIAHNKVNIHKSTSRV